VLRLILAELSHRRGRALALVAGIAVATASFTVLTGASETTRLAVEGNVTEHFRTAYDVLVRPSQAAQPAERREALIQQNFISGTFGGITMDQLREVRRTAGVQVAAPLAVFGYLMPSAQLAVPLRDRLSSGPRTVFRVETRWAADRGHVRVREPDSYVYATRRRLQRAPGHIIGSPTRVQASEEGPAGLQPVCPVPSAAASAFSAAARSSFLCWSTQTGPEGLASPGARAAQPDRLGAIVQFPFPLLLAGVDPQAEAELSGADQAVVSGRWLREEDEPKTHGPGYPLTELPVLAASRPDLDLSADVRVFRLPKGTGHGVYSAGDDRAAAQRALRQAGAGEPIARRSISAEQAYGALLRQLRDPQMIEASWRAGPTRYTVRGASHLEAVPVRSDPFVWGSATGATGTRTGFVNAPPTAHGVGFRPLEENVATTYYDTPIPAMRAVGTFDPRRLPGFSDPDVAPLSAFHVATATGADERSRRALGGRRLAPDGNMAGYLTAPPLLLTTIAARSMLLDPRRFGKTVEHQQAAPISAVRVRVRGVTGADETSRERIRVVAERIAEKTGLQVDVTAGSSPTPVRVDLPASGFGRPRLALRESWVKKGVATAILTAVDRKSLILFALVLLVCGLFCVNATSAAVRTRSTELGILACTGWPARRLFAYLLAEIGMLGLAAGVLGAAVALPVGAVLDLPVTGARAAIAVPAATALALLAGIAPARRASRSDPMSAVRHVALDAGSARAVRTVAGLAMTNLIRVPGRTALGALSLGVGIFALTVLLAVTFAFRGAVVGTVLGDAVAVQVRAADYVAVVAALALSTLAVGDVLYLNLRERSAEIATLRATGWREGQLLRLVTLEGAGIGALGGLAGAALGFVAAGIFGGQWTATMGLVAAAAAALALGLAVVASLPPAARLRRLPTAMLLAEE
jgi:putative ABC transport system permease protein